MLTPDQVNQMLSDNFNGDPTLEVYESYTGAEDMDVESFSGKGLLDLEKSTKRFGVRVKNTYSEAKEVVITPALFPTARPALVFDDNGTHKYKKPGGYAVPAPTGAAVNDIIMEYNSIKNIIAAGHNVDAVFDDGIILAASASQQLTVEATGTNALVRQFLQYLKENPTIFAGMHIVADNTAAFEVDLRLRRISPFKVYDEERIPFQDAFKPENRNVEKIVVQREFQLDGNTLGILTVPGNTTMTITFVAGASSSQAIALKRKFKTAKETGHRRHIFSMRPPVQYGIQPPNHGNIPLIRK